MSRYNQLTDIEIQNLPIYVVEKAYYLLKVYPECVIRYENGNYIVTPGSGSYANTYNDYRLIGKVIKEQFYDEDEIMLNYVEQTHEYPDGYTVERVDLSNYSWATTFKFDDLHNIVKE